MSQIDTQLRQRVDAFVADLTDLIRQSALEAVQGALGNGGVAAAPRARRGPGRPRKAAKATTTRKGGKRIRRSSEEVEALGSAVLAHVKANPGQRLGEIASALGVATKDARRPAFSLVEAGELKTTGQRGGTRYFAKGASTASTPNPKTKTAGR